jgi:hypothetical protein
MITALILLALLPFFVVPTTVYLVRVHDFSIIKATIVAFGIMFGAMLLCVEDINAAEDCSDIDAEAACGIDCTQYVTWLRDLEINGKIEVQFLVTELVREQPTDSVLVDYGKCVLQMLETAERTHGKEAYGHIMNHRPKTPPQPRIISYQRAQEMAFEDPADPEELGYAVYGYWPDWND